MEKIEKVKRFIKKRIASYEERVDLLQNILLSERLDNESKSELIAKRDRIWYRDDEALEILRYITKLESEESEKEEK